MLDVAFMYTRNYRELITGDAWRFVVGRRGSGKSALCRKLREYLYDKRIATTDLRPKAEETQALSAKLDALKCTYDQARSISRLLWKTLVLTSCVEPICKHYTHKNKPIASELRDFKNRHGELLAKEGGARMQAVLDVVTSAPVAAYEIPQKIAAYLDLARLEDRIQTLASETNGHTRFRYVCLFDGLDEGWIPSPVSTGIVGGLAKFASECRETDLPVHCVLFLRDNMARALAELDSDYTRNIEPSSLRLHWDEEALFGLVCARLRVAFDVSSDNKVKIWGRFAQRELAGLDGFRQCLKQTLYRPRDLISLLNAAWQNAGRSGEREAIVASDLNMAAEEISRNRLRDLKHEYAEVLPGLDGLIEVFRAGPTQAKHSDVLGRLDAHIRSGGVGRTQRDLALFSTAPEAFDLLFSVGFIGLEGSDSYLFCHDGADASYKFQPTNPTTLVHPAYWRALALQMHESTAEVTIRVDDSEDIAKQERPKSDIARRRLTKLGQIASELKSIRTGRDDAHRFEEWLFTALRVLFDYSLDNIELHPNGVSSQRRDVVGRISSESGFFGRLHKDYSVRQLVFEAKNYSELGPDEFRQAWGYMAGQYGRLIVLVNRRGENEKLSDNEKTWIKSGYLEQGGKMVLVLSSEKIQRALEKLRNAKSDRYLEDKLNSLLDQYERSYTQVK